MNERPSSQSSRRESLSLHDAAELILEECRMVLPGIQALFGFQLIAVFSDGFARLTLAEQRIHLLAIVLVVIAAAFVMTPAAYHRQTGAREVPSEFITLSTRLLLFGMIWVRATWPRIRYDRLMSFSWKILLPLSLAITFITATGIVLADLFNNQLYYWAIPFVSVGVGLFTVVMIYRELRRKAYERA